MVTDAAPAVALLARDPAEADGELLDAPLALVSEARPVSLDIAPTWSIHAAYRSTAITSDDAAGNPVGLTHTVRRGVHRLGAVVVPCPRTEV